MLLLLFFLRTCHTDGAPSLTRYTDRINPELKASTSCEEENHVYSTLNLNQPSPQSDVYPLPPPPNWNPHPSQEMEMTTRKTSRSLLLGESPPTNATPFQIVHEGIPCPEPYQIAMSSKENLTSTDDTPESVEQQLTTWRDSTVRTGSGYNRTTRTNHTLPKGAVSAGGQVVSATNPVAAYEQIDQPYSGNNFSSRLHTPTRTVSSGHVRSPHRGPFKRRTSAIESNRRDSTEDYSHLNRGQPNQRVRGKSLSSLTVPTQSNAQIQHSELEKHRNYSRNSLSPDSQDSLSLTMRNTHVFTPTSEGPPPYRDTLSSVSSPYSPSGSSMLENGAYEGTNPQMQAAMNREGGERMESEGLDEQQPWYHNASDFSLQEDDPYDRHHQQQQRNMHNSNTAIQPYSQVSNRLEENMGGSASGVSRFYVKNNSLSRMHQSSHFHTVVV